MQNLCILINTNTGIYHLRKSMGSRYCACHITFFLVKMWTFQKFGRKTMEPKIKKYQRKLSNKPRYLPSFFILYDSYSLSGRTRFIIRSKWCWVVIRISVTRSSMTPASNHYYVQHLPCEVEKYSAQSRFSSFCWGQTSREPVRKPVVAPWFFAPVPALDRAALDC